VRAGQGLRYEVGYRGRERPDGHKVKLKKWGEMKIKKVWKETYASDTSGRRRRVLHLQSWNRCSCLDRGVAATGKDGEGQDLRQDGGEPLR